MGVPRGLFWNGSELVAFWTVGPQLQAQRLDRDGRPLEAARVIVPDLHSGTAHSEVLDGDPFLVRIGGTEPITVQHLTHTRDPDGAADPLTKV